LDTNTVTITGWMNPSGDQSGWAGVVFCRGGTTVSGVNFGPGSPANELRFTWNNNQFNVSTGLIVPTNQWSFFALVVTPTGGTVYLGTNGVLNSVTESAALTSSAFDAPLLLGEDPSSGGRYYAGALDEVAVFNRSLSPAQIQQLYSNALVGTGCQTITASISGAPGAPICAGTTVNLTASGSNGVGALTYSWTTNGTPFATTQSITDIPAPGTNTYAVTVTDANGCYSSPVSVTVAIKAPPAITGQPTNQTVVAGSNGDVLRAGHRRASASLPMAEQRQQRRHLEFPFRRHQHQLHDLRAGHHQQRHTVPRDRQRILRVACDLFGGCGDRYRGVRGQRRLCANRGQ
jgi:hypothetical protein